MFTAMADVLAGFLMTSDSFSPVAKFTGLLAASVCLYWSGMVFNDVFDLKQDQAERPGRPIPSGDIPIRSAVIFGTTLMVLGIVLAGCVSVSSLMIAACLAVTILAYDGGLKRTVLGPLAMGGCRFFNILLAASAIGDWPLIWQRPQLQVAAGLGVYVVGLTWFARNEASKSQRNQLIAAAIVCLTGVMILGQLPFHSNGAVSPSVIQTALVIIAVVVGRRLLTAISKPEPRAIQLAIKTMLLSIVTIDATMIYFRTGNAVYALVAVALIVPAMLLSRRFAMT